MRKMKTVKITLDPVGDADSIVKAFTVKELTIQNILDLSQSNAFFKKEDGSVAPAIKKEQNGEESAEPAPEKSLMGQLTDMATEVKSIMEMTCDFTMDDLKKLSPSEVRVLFQEFQEVNQDFLDLLRTLKILQAFKGILERAFSSFSEMFVI
ncbi:MAG: hypothetical protein PF503_06240 [Desulfobacula sp.]|jgi:hypothetical protein|nr:hypothetical protein [Desulfobacula sp.]